MLEAAKVTLEVKMVELEEEKEGGFIGAEGRWVAC